MENKNIKNEKLPIETQLAMTQMEIIARTEMADMFAYVLNAFLNVRQTKDNKLSEEEVSAIQKAFNDINKTTQNKYEQLVGLVKEIKN